MCLMSEMLQLFPSLHWGLIESANQGVPWICNEIVWCYGAEDYLCPDDILGDNHVFVTLQTDDDILWLLKR